MFFSFLLPLFCLRDGLGPVVRRQILTCHASDKGCEPSMLGRVVFDSMGSFGYHSEYAVDARLKVVKVRNVNEKKEPVGRSEIKRYSSIHMHIYVCTCHQ